MLIGLAYPNYENYPKWRWIACAMGARGHRTVPVRTLEELHAADKVCDLILFAQYQAGIPDAPTIAKGPTIMAQSTKAVE
jgi:hypothetical protein